MDDVESLLEEITNASGPTGFEGPVRSIMQRELSPLCDELETDGIGSLIGRLGEGSDRPRVMMAAHMDEVGLMVRFITAEGYIKFQTLGGMAGSGPHQSALGHPDQERAGGRSIRHQDGARYDAGGADPGIQA